MNIWWYHIGNKSSFRCMGIKVKEFKIKPISHSNNVCSHSLGKKSLDFLLSAGTLICFGTQKILFAFQSFYWLCKIFSNSATLNTEFMVALNSVHGLEATWICFGDIVLHCYVPEWFWGGGGGVDQVLTLAIANFGYVLLNFSHFMWGVLL